MTDVLVLFGSKSDIDSYKQILKILDKEKVSYDFKIASAHKTPEDVDNILKQDYKVVISGAGLAAALPGVVAARTIRPIIGVPCQGSYQGLDALLSIAQMPPGIPVLSVGVEKADIAAHAAVKILKRPDKVVLVGDKNNKAYKKAEEILRDFGVNHSHSEQIIDNAINIDFVYFDEPIENKDQLIIYCPLLLEDDDKAEASLNLLKHSDHGLWVGLNNGTNAALAAIEILNIDNSFEQKLVSYRKEIGDKVREYNK
ncbi:MAG: 5-(carboxyamino)imidazole ribonucleotide mutase [Flavobacteriales bacterium]|jgi:5-(carboxyamino)imidazole ribonucleotide mutase|nr:5-(carboxyamino)imidazole ribonucleotide mutase [Flavobacteriales bacterium]